MADDVTTYSGKARVVCELDISVFGLDVEGVGYQEVNHRTVLKALEEGYYDQADSDDLIHHITRVVSIDLGPDPQE